MEEREMKRSIFAGALIVVLALAMSIPASAAERTVFRGIDLWQTPADGRTYIEFRSDPIPAGFFCALSEPFSGRITWQGAPIATGVPGALGKTDTIVERLDDAVFNRRGRAASRVQLRALSLVSIAPIKTSCGSFQAKAVLDGVQPVTRMRLVRNNEKGGFYVAPLELNVKLLFTPVQNPNARPLVLKHNVRFNHNPRMPWVMGRLEGQVLSHEAFVKVDTDGDGTPDSTLPGTSNFTPGFGAREKIIEGCHTYYDEYGNRKMHCPDYVEP
jgi:hypothetical protein